MALWGKTDQANNAPKTTHFGGGSTANGQALYGNTTNNGFVGNAVTGIFMADLTEVAVDRKGLAPGWNRITYGTGPVITVAPNARGTGFANGDTLIISNGSINAIATVTANATGNVTALSLASGGAGFVNTASVAAAVTAKSLTAIAVANAGAGYAVGQTVVVSNNEYIVATANVTAVNANNGVSTLAILTKGSFKPAGTNAQLSFTVLNSAGGPSTGTGATFTGGITSAGSGATVTVTLGGKAGRRSVEPLIVIMAPNGADGTDDAVLPDA